MREGCNGKEGPYFEIFPLNYDASLYAFSNKDKINKLIKKVELSTNELEEYARDIGTNLHEWIDLYVKGKKPAIPNSEPLKTMVNKWLKWWKASKLEIVESELPLYSSKYDLAGTLDLIVTQKSWKGKLALLDTKIKNMVEKIYL